MTIHSFNGSAEREHRKFDSVTQKLITTVTVGDVIVEIDVDRLVREYGAKAFFTKTRTSRYMDGCVVFKARNVKSHQNVVER